MCLGEILILSSGIAVVQYQAVCGIEKISGNFNTVGGFLMILCAVFRRISSRFCGIRTLLTPPSRLYRELFLIGKQTWFN